MAKKDICALKSCNNVVGPGSANVGYVNEEGRTVNIRVCARCTWKIMTAPRGLLRINDRPDIEMLPSKQYFT